VTGQFPKQRGERSTVVLALMMKDEDRVLQRCLKSVRPFIDAWCIMDTGSTDQSVTLAQLMMEGVPGDLIRSEWVNFGANRAELVAHAQTLGDYLLLMDADNELVVTGERPEHLAATMYNVYTRGDDCWTPRLIKSGMNWAYVGTTHEYLACITDTPTTKGRCTWWQLEHYGDGARRPRKAAEDETMLRAELAVDPDNPRVNFYLANALRDQGKYAEALKYYQRRVELGGWMVEADLAAEQIERFLKGDFRGVGVPGQ
jgi:glycosyltransferase involved in cell wall biosynthesis